MEGQTLRSGCSTGWRHEDSGQSRGRNERAARGTRTEVGRLSAGPDGEEMTERERRILAEAIDLLGQTRHTFKSKQIERVRHLLEALLRGAEEIHNDPDPQS